MKYNLFYHRNRFSFTGALTETEVLRTATITYYLPAAILSDTYCEYHPVPAFHQQVNNGALILVRPSTSKVSQLIFLRSHKHTGNLCQTPMSVMTTFGEKSLT